MSEASSPFHDGILSYSVLYIRYRGAASWVRARLTYRQRGMPRIYYRALRPQVFNAENLEWAGPKLRVRLNWRLLADK